MVEAARERLLQKDELAGQAAEVLARHGYELKSPLGRGGQATVYKAYDARQNTMVALKIVSGEDEDRRRRLVQEFSFLKIRAHPNLLTVHDLREAQLNGVSHIWFTMELCSGSLASTLSESELKQALAPGDPLTQKIITEQRRQGRRINRMQTVELRQRIMWVLEALQSLAYIHHQSISHRDIKPANLLIDRDGLLKLGDFGTAKMAWERDRYGSSERHYLIGTPQYIAPEFWRALLDADLVEQDLILADQYALGITVVELLQRGKRPSALEELPAAPRNMAELALYQQIHEQGSYAPLQIPEWQGSPDYTNEVIAKMLAVNPHARYENLGRCSLDLVSALMRDGLLKA